MGRSILLIGSDADFQNVEDGQWINFIMPMSLNELIRLNGIDEMNDFMDEFLSQKGFEHTLVDISYTPDNIGDEMIMIMIHGQAEAL